MMFLSGVFFPLEAMPQFLQSVARLIPLTYLADALRQVMVGGIAVRVAVGSVRWSCSAGWSSASRSPRASSAGSEHGVRPAGRAAAAAYQRSWRTISSSGRRPPARGGRVRSSGSAG